MRKYILVIILSFAGIHFTFSQLNSGRITDSLRIDSLKKVLPTLQDSSRINCLNAICDAYEYFSTPGPAKGRPIDSTYYYASKSNKEATRLGFKYGQAFSLLHLAWYETMKNNDSTAYKYVQQALSLGENIRSDKVLGWAYYFLTYIKPIRNNFQEVINNYKKAVVHFQKAGDEEGEAEVTAWLCIDYNTIGDYEKAVDYCQRSYILSQKTKTKNIEWGNFLAQFSVTNMAELYRSAGDYTTALDYYRKGFQYAKEHSMTWNMEGEMGLLYERIGQSDSALFYFQRSMNNADTTRMWTKSCQGRIYLMEKEYSKALDQFKECIKMTKETNYIGKWTNFHLAAKAFQEMKKYKDAVKYERKAVSIANSRNMWQWKMDSYSLISDLFNQLGKNDSAYIYLKKYTLMKDSTNNRQFQWKLNNLKVQAENEQKEAQLALLGRDNKIKEQQLRQEAQLKKFLIFGLLGLLLTGFFIFRTLVLKRKNEKLVNEKIKAELQHKVGDLEMQALRAQMNPHFIFNCLSSINRFIFKNDNKLASDYLTRFSRLIRMVLMNSSRKLITLEDELEMLRLYLDLERLRFKDAFDYSITTTNIVDAGAIFIPPLLLQPFCENAVWHGLMHKESKGHLNLIISEAISENEKILHCVIEDDGIGREKAAELKSKSAENEKSMGLKITTERLALLNQENNFSTFYKIEDVLNENNQVAGTRVQLKIRFKESVEEINNVPI